MQAYSDPARESDPHALPDLEIFRAECGYCPECGGQTLLECGECGECEIPLRCTLAVEWWVWVCFPGCLPDSEAIGPYETSEDALAAARESWGPEW